MTELRVSYISKSVNFLGSFKRLKLCFVRNETNYLLKGDTTTDSVTLDAEKLTPIPEEEEAHQDSNEDGLTPLLDRVAPIEVRAVSNPEFCIEHHHFGETALGTLLFFWFCHKSEDAEEQTLCALDS